MLEYEDNSENWKACLRHLLTSRVEAWRSGHRATIGQLLDEVREAWKSGVGAPDARTIKQANDLLAQAGVKLLPPGTVDGDREDGWALAIPNESQLVAAQFRDTVWAGVPGASVWKSALRQGPAGVIVVDGKLNKVRINGFQSRCTIVRLKGFEEEGTERGRKTQLSQTEAVEIFKRQHSAIRAEREAEETQNTSEEKATPSLKDVDLGPSIQEESHRAQLAKILRGMSPKGFENFAAFLLRKAGFTEVNVTGKTNDGGIDGIGYLRINPMMTTTVLFQCKRYTDKAVDKDEIMKFQAAVLRERAEKGLFLTTSSFTRPAKDEAMKGAKEIELIDLQRLIDLLETMKLGLKEKTILVVDASFFEEYGTDK